MRETMISTTRERSECLRLTSVELVRILGAKGNVQRIEKCEVQNRSVSVIVVYVTSARFHRSRVCAVIRGRSVSGVADDSLAVAKTVIIGSRSPAADAESIAWLTSDARSNGCKDDASSLPRFAHSIREAGAELVKAVAVGQPVVLLAAKGKKRRFILPTPGSGCGLSRPAIPIRRSSASSRSTPPPPVRPFPATTASPRLA